MQWETAKPTGPVSEILPANAARCWKAKITLCVPVGPSFVSMTAAGKGVITRHNPPSRVLDAAYMQREKGRKQLTKANACSSDTAACTTANKHKKQQAALLHLASYVPLLAEGVQKLFFCRAHEMV
jgi:hypothetical protein